ncbi:hypothetical protein EHQ92_12750 [Leptospira biflexa]|uniref:hypothetical protein n=1 Tax=Leptospira biflexa TaxID=172 RepID=UPI001091049D|nr:hypothetical protein [Leptospira biflexa]TGM48695.1 hypothetical protein EHQ92_12750 [Leptospira biflexa]
MEKRFKLRAEHVYAMLNDQDYKCFVSGVKLTYQNLELAYKIPLYIGGKHELSNVCLVDRSLKELKKFKTNEEIVIICKEIIKNAIRLSNH